MLYLDAGFYNKNDDFYPEC